MMKIVALTHGLWYGGAQAVILNYLSLLKAKGVDLDVVTCDNSNKQFLSGLNDLGIRIHKVPCKVVDGYPDLFIEAAANVVKEAEIIWITDIEYLAAPRIKRLTAVPIVAHLHSYALICPWWAASYGLQETCTRSCRNDIFRFTKCKILRNRIRHQYELYNYTKVHELLTTIKAPIDYFKWLEKGNVIKYIDALIAVSKAVKDLHLLHLPELKEKPFEVIYNPVIIPEKFLKRSLDMEYNGNSNIIVYASGFQVAKGIHILIRALKIASKDVPQIRLAVTRSKPGEEALIYLARKEGVDGLIDFYGSLPKSDLYALYINSRAVVVPSIWPEPFSVVALEANKLGVPVVASNIGGLPEVVEDGVTGILVKPNDPNALAEGIVKVFNQKFSREKISIISRQKFDVDTIIKQFLNFLQKIT
ncbi:glycosyltransferase family 4 protein [Vulcanisaeta thermophila]|uniref:glycosyltransferase family 4 protein n=1 Tax=Vulcanisaeta thermophila TaxID=867917 RepID=UPI00085342B8|nr:glycosyltransferase family 4 protein [Vulcanisaeta thermophila]